MNITVTEESANPLRVVIMNFNTLAPMDCFGSVGVTTGGITGRGTNCSLQVIGCNILGNNTGNGVCIADGTHADVQASVISGFTNGIHVWNQGDVPTIHVNACLLSGNALDVNIEHPQATGTINAVASQDNVQIHADADVSAVIQDISAGNLSLSGDFYQGATFNEITNLTPIMIRGQAAGVISGGELVRDDSETDRQVKLMAGSGYIYSSTDPEDSQYLYLTWDEQTKVVSANKHVILYVDSDGVLQELEGTPSFYGTIVVGRTITTSNDIILCDPTRRRISSAISRLERIFRYYVGAVYSTGSIVEADTRNLNITGGNYCYSTWEYNPIGGEDIEFTTMFRNGGWYTFTPDQTLVPNDKYDDGTGTLHDLTDTKWVKHLLMIYGGNNDEPEQYFLVYGQEEFDSQEAAESGGLPTIPNPCVFTITTIASIVIQKGGNIASIQDLRPTLTSKSGTSFSSGGNDHSALLHLDADDHKQYLLGDGSRAMTGSLNMGTKNITNVGTVDGVNVDNHSDRHAPNAADALPTESAIGLTPSSANAEGTHAYFARSDHTHQITGFQESIVGAASTITTSNLTANRALISNASGKVAVSTNVSDVELEYLDGATSNVQDQIDNLQAQIDNLGGGVTCRTTVNQTTTSASAVNVTNMSLPIGANQIRDVIFVVFCGCGGNSGSKLAITVPSGATMSFTFLGIEKNDGASFVGETMTASGTLTTVAVAKNTIGYARIRGLVSNGANAGNVQLQFASATVGQTSTIYSNSYGISRLMT
jgi:hypothetical protein